MSYTLAGNPNKNFYETRKKPVRLIILHVTAGLEDLDLTGTDHSAEKTNAYGASTDRAASWHVCVDSDSIAPALPNNYTAFHCVGYNSESLGLEISNRDARWDNKPREWTRKTLVNAAIVCLSWEREFDIPRVLLTKAEVDAGRKGYSYHMFLDPARRKDPGVTFPWKQFVEILEILDANTSNSGEPFIMDAKTTAQVRKVVQEELSTVLGERRADKKDTDPTHVSISDLYTQGEKILAWLEASNRPKS